MRPLTIFEARNNVGIITLGRRVTAYGSATHGWHHYGGSQLLKCAHVVAVHTNGALALYCSGWLHPAVKRAVLPAAISDGCPVKHPPVLLSRYPAARRQ